MWMLAIGTALAIAPQEVPNPRVHGGWVSDVAGALDPSEVAAIDALLDDLNRDLGVEVAVTLVDSTDDLTPKEFTSALFAHWGVGRRGADNGLLVTLVLSQRRLEMETGYGLEGLLPDGWLGRMQADHMVPRFREEDYGGGLLAGLRVTAERLRAHPVEAQLGSRIGELQTEAWPESPPDRRGSPLSWDAALFGVFGTALGVIGGGLGLVVRRRRRTCPRCGVFMPMLDEDADDAWLSEGAIREELLGSVDHQVHLCPTCDEVRVFRRVRWWSEWQNCPKCHYRTRRSVRTTVRPPTQYTSGRARVTEICDHCGDTKAYNVRIPPIGDGGSSRSSGGGSRSSGGGGFGGGRSGGGGAGSSW